MKPQDVLDFATVAVRELLEADVATLWLLDESGSLTLSSQSSEAGTVLPPRTGAASIAGSVTAYRIPRYSPVLLEDPLLGDREWALAAGIVSQMTVPLIAGDTVLGALTVAMKRRRTFTEEEVAVIEVFAAKAATALHNARLYQRAQDAYDEMRRTQSALLQSQKMEALGRLSGGDRPRLQQLPDGHRRPRGADRSPCRAGLEHPARRGADCDDDRAGGRAHAAAPRLQPPAGDGAAPARRQRRHPRAHAALDPLLGEEVEVTFETGLEPAVVIADGSQLEQVVLNLCVNARDAMPAGGRLELATTAVTLPSPTVGPGLDLAPGPYVHLTVRDTGVGMDAEIMERIFDPFFTTKSPGTGTGLGLATVYGIVRQSAGAVTVDSVPGAGSMFHVLLPVVERAAIAATSSGVSAELPRGTETILLVEDEEEVRRFVRDVIEDLGYRVLDADGPKTARVLTEAHDGPIHLLLTDVVMPEEGGPALADALRAARPGLRVIYMSGYSPDAMRSTIRDTGVEFLQKPFAPVVLAEAIRKVLDAGG